MLSDPFSTRSSIGASRRRFLRLSASTLTGLLLGASPRRLRAQANDNRREMKVPGESLVLAGTQPGNLCFDGIVTGSLVLRSTYQPRQEKTVVYKEGSDFTVDYAKGTIARTEGSPIPDYSKHPLYGLKDFDHSKFRDFSNHPYFVWADYTTTNGRRWAEPNDQRPFLMKTRAKLQAGGPFQIVTYGDSITAGGEASTPDLRFQALYGKYLQGKFPAAKIDVQDVSISGRRAIDGINRWDEYIGKTSPDLALIGWGMNDHNIGGPSPEEYGKNLMKLVEMVRDRKGAETILYSTFPPNENWHFGSHRMPQFAAAAKRAASDAKCAYVNVFDTWELVLKRKDQSSLLGNNINHPNDFGHWLYEQAFEAMEF